MIHHIKVHDVITSYFLTDIPSKWLDRWINADPYPQFHLPEKNIYLTTNFDLVEPDPIYKEEAEEHGVELSTVSAKDISKKLEGSKKKVKEFKHGDLIATVNNFR